MTKTKSNLIIIASFIILGISTFFGVYKYAIHKINHTQFLQNSNKTQIEEKTAFNLVKDEPILKVNNSNNKTTGTINPSTLSSESSKNNCILTHTGTKFACANQIIENQPIVLQQPESQQIEMKTYINSQFGFSFKHPEEIVCDSSIQNTTLHYPVYLIVCGNKNIDGGRADREYGSIEIYLDNGQSEQRTEFRKTAVESATKIYGDNKFYNGYIVERPAYVFLVLSGSKINLESLIFE